MTPDQLRWLHAELDLVGRRRELMFWTIMMTLASVVLMAMTLALLASIIWGMSVRAADVSLCVVIAGASAGG